jgi:hypothetical protein
VYYISALIIDKRDRMKTRISLGGLASAICLACVADAVRVGVLLPFGAQSVADVKTAEDALVGANLAAADFPTVEFVFANDSCTSDGGIAASITLIDAGADVLVGPSCNIACESSSYVSKHEKIAQIAYACGFDSFSNKEKFPLFSRMIAPSKLYRTGHGGLHAGTEVDAGGDCVSG